ncbi:thrombospondin-2-like [Dendronephthya gigantea]|uniref:thrombospondin-2-like n=1 Tax=Dendronephthya gigantea TaxID=151771 RepID=UPI00106B1CB0|nr:thrombospondin-2-like [Dendronephthya gigantea]
MKLDSSWQLVSFLLLLIGRTWGQNTSTTTRQNYTKDVKPTSRQQVPYNFDLVNKNGSSTLMYSQPNDVVNGGFTEWSAWSECNSRCGKRSLKSRERYCTNPSPSRGGADCNGERFQLDLCKLVPCPHAVTSSPRLRHVIGKFGQWSGWSRCDCEMGYQKRYRECFSHKHGPCVGHGIEKRACKPTGCKTPAAEKSSLVDIDPKQFCGFNPCDISKCLLAPLGSCVSDYKCRPVFFDENNKRIQGCVGQHIYITPAQVPQVCKINPCVFTRCLMDFTEERCVVGTRCQAVYYSASGQPQKCTAVLKIPAHQVCGYDPCNGESCEDNPNARCLVTTRCRPVFVNSFNERIRKCEEEVASKNNRIEEGRDEEFEAEPDDEDDDQDEESDDQDDDDNRSLYDDYDRNDSEDNDDDEYDSNRYSYPKHFHGVERDDSDELVRPEVDQGSSEDGDEDDEDADRNLDDFKKKLANAETNRPQEHSEQHTRPQTPNANMLENTKNFSNPLLKLLNVENGDRRSKKPHKVTSSINPSSFNLQDLVSGKLDNSSGLVVGTVKKSMKILSNKKPTTYYYFETKGKTHKDNRQFMVITAPKTKKSSVHPKSTRNRQN